MADRYWVTGGNGVWTSTGNWSATSGGSSGASVPTNSDNAFFDQTATYTVTGNATALNLLVSAGTVTFTLGINGFGGTAATYFTFNSGTVAGFSASSTTTFSTTTTLVINTNGVALTGAGSVIFGTNTRTGTVSLGSDFAITGAIASAKVTLAYGTLDLGSFKLTSEGQFVTANAVTHTLAFGTGNITITGVNTGGVAWDSSAGTNNVTGTPVVNVSYNAAGTVGVATQTGGTEANSISFNFTTGTYTLNFLNTTGYVARSVSFAGFGGTWAARTTNNTIYGDLTLSSVAGFSTGASTGILTLGSTSGTTRVLTGNGKTFDGPITINGVGGTFQLADAFSLGSTRLFTHTNGTLNLNGKVLTVGTSYTTAAGTKVLTFNGGTLACPAASTTAFNNAVSTGFSTVAGTGTGKISMTAATAKTFVGASSTFNCTLSNDGAGALTITGSNTFGSIANGVSPTSFLFTASTTTTVSGWTVSGTAGNLVTIGSVTAASHTLAIVGATVISNYLSISRSSASGSGSTWYAGGASTDGGNNTGWIFSTPAFVTGLATTSAVGTPLTGVVTPVSPTGLSATGSVGSPTVTTLINATVNVTGVASTSAVGTSVATSNAIVAFEGWNRSLGWGVGPFGSGSATIGLATGSVGTPSVLVNASVSVTGVSSTTAVGTVTVVRSTVVPVTGVSATGFVGTATVTFSSSVSVTGLSATGSVGTTTVQASSNVSVTGLSATGSVGTATASVSPFVSVTGQYATGLVGTAVGSVSATANVTGRSATGSVGTVTIDYTIYTPVTGVASTTRVGTPTVRVDCAVPVTGVYAAGSVGAALARIDITINPTGYVATGSVGQVLASINATVNLAGVYATGYVGQALVWGQIIPGQTPAWAEIDPTQSASWTQITPSQTPVWTEISA